MKYFFTSIFTAALISLTSIAAYHFFNTQKKIGFVKTGVVIQKYKGMTEANGRYNSELAVVQGNLDTLKQRYENLKRFGEGNQKDVNWNQRVATAEKEFMQYNQTAQQQLLQRQQELTKQILDNINNYVQNYGKKNGYALILGTTSDGSILYGVDKDDLTDKILQDLNQIYDTRNTSSGNK